MAEPSIRAYNTLKGDRALDRPSGFYEPSKDPLDFLGKLLTALQQGTPGVTPAVILPGSRAMRDIALSSLGASPEGPINPVLRAILKVNNIRKRPKPQMLREPNVELPMWELRSPAMSDQHSVKAFADLSRRDAIPPTQVAEEFKAMMQVVDNVSRKPRIPGEAAGMRRLFGEAFHPFFLRD